MGRGRTRARNALLSATSSYGGGFGIRGLTTAPRRLRRASSRTVVAPAASYDDAAPAGQDGEGGEENLEGLGLSEEEEQVLLASKDENVLTTALSRSIAVEDYALAAKLSERLKTLQGVGEEPGAEILDWRALGMAEWLCSRAEDLGFRYPTAVQRRASLAFFKDKDIVIQAQTGSGKTLAYLMPTIDNMEFTARRMLQILVIVPSRELTIQTVMLAYRLFGGNVNVGIPGDPGNMFKYFGPQGIKCVGVFEQDHIEWEGFADVAEIVVGTPEYLTKMKESGKLEVDLATTIIADEADQLFEQYPNEMATLLKPSPYEPVMKDRQIVLCGVNVPREVVALCEQRGFVTSPLMVSMGTPGRVPPSVVHRRMVVPRMRKILALARQIRSDLKAAGEDAPPPRTIVFVPSAAAAEAAAVPLRKSLWNQHKLAVLLPEGKEAVRTVMDFKNMKSTLLLCTPEVERGLDMPGVDYVYSLDAPTTAASYLHRAGRCGRLGATSTGIVTSLVTAEEEPVLDQAMNDLEIRCWETLEEQSVNQEALAAAAAEAAKLLEEAEQKAEAGAEDGESEDDDDDGGGWEGKRAAEDEERALTAAALNDIFYTLDAQAEMVNTLEDIFNGEDATKEEPDSWDDVMSEEEDVVYRQEEEQSQRLQAAIDDVKKIFDPEVTEDDLPEYLRKKKEDQDDDPTRR